MVPALAGVAKGFDLGDEPGEGGVQSFTRLVAGLRFALIKNEETTAFDAVRRTTLGMRKTVSAVGHYFRKGNSRSGIHCQGCVCAFKIMPS